MRHLLRQVAKAPLVAAGALQETVASDRDRLGVIFLAYHTVGGVLNLELDVGPELFRQQMAHLAASERVIGYDDALRTLRAGCEARNAVVLTFDDGYLDFYTVVFPLLQELNLPATLFVNTGFVEERVAYPMLSHPSAKVEPVTWEMLGEMAESEWVTLGAHTHTHPVLAGELPDRIEEELARPIELFQSRLGFTPRHFAYPRVEWTPQVEELVSRHYESAVIGGGQVATSANFHPYRIPRLPIRRSDGWWFFRAKLRGWLAGEEAMYAKLHRWTGR